VVLIDFNRDWKIDEEIVTDRRKLADDGLVTIVVTVNSKGEVVVGPDIALRGIILPRGVPAEEFVIKLSKQVETILRNGAKNGAPVGSADGAREALISGLEIYMQEELKINPLLQVLTMHANTVKKTPSTVRVSLLDDLARNFLRRVCQSQAINTHRCAIAL
jgi:Predicted hydrolase of the metallo-beta-lactamase superfamily